MSHRADTGGRVLHRADLVAAWLALAWTACLATIAIGPPSPGPVADGTLGLGLTDLALATEARYVRHLSMSDGFAPRQDHPGALERAPSGTAIMPRPRFRWITAEPSRIEAGP